IVAQSNRQHAVLEAVVGEDVGERRSDDCPEAVLTECPRRMLARRSTTEVLVSDQDRRALITRLVQDERGIRNAVCRVAPVVKEKLPEAGALNAFQKLLRNDLIGIDVCTIERRDQPGMLTKRNHGFYSNSQLLFI